MVATIDNSRLTTMLSRARAQLTSMSTTHAIVRIGDGEEDHRPANTLAPIKVSSKTFADKASSALSQIGDGFALLQTTRQNLTDLSLYLDSYRPLAGGSGSGWRLALDQHITDMQDIAAQASFHGQPLFDGATHTFSFDIGIAAQHSLKLDISIDMERSLVEHVTIGGEDISNGVFLGEAGLAIQVGDETVALYGSYKTGQDLVNAINEAAVYGLTATLTSDGRLRLHSYRPIEIAGRGANAQHVDISGTLSATPVWVPQSVPLLKSTAHVDVDVAHVDRLLTAIDVQQGKLDAFQNQLEAALGHITRTTALAQGVNADQLARELATDLRQQPGQAAAIQANATPNDVRASSESV